MKPKRVLLINYFLMLGGGERLLIELVDYWLQHGVIVEVLIPDNKAPQDNEHEEYYDAYLKERGVKVHRVPVFHKRIKALASLLYWRFRLKFARLFYSSVHIINLNLSDRLFEIVRHPRRYFWHIGNRLQFANQQYPYRQQLVSQSSDTIVTINKYQLKELQDYFPASACHIIPFKLFLNRK